MHYFLSMLLQKNAYGEIVQKNGELTTETFENIGTDVSSKLT